MSAEKIGYVYYPKVSLVQPKVTSTLSTPKDSTGSLKPTFAQVLDKTLSKDTLKFSKHAQVRLNERGIQLSQEQLERLEQGLNKAKNKGARESLFLMGDLAFVVSVKNETVITAMDREQMKEQVITNIDSTLLL